MATQADWRLEKYRPLLWIQTRQLQQDLRLRVRLDWSDLVQEAYLKAHRDFADF
jgi:DNA-directed RNA polymerase specialized sigma24 family protein